MIGQVTYDYPDFIAIYEEFRVRSLHPPAWNSRCTGLRLLRYEVGVGGTGGVFREEVMISR